VEVLAPICVDGGPNHDAQTWREQSPDSNESPRTRATWPAPKTPCSFCYYKYLFDSMETLQLGFCGRRIATHPVASG
jgi:hypothetical protein